MSLFMRTQPGTQADHELRLNNVTGYGILIVKGDLQLAGNINWHGIIIATGIVTSSGGGPKIFRARCIPAAQPL
jgi:hypothetical protein